MFLSRVLVKRVMVHNTKYNGIKSKLSHTIVKQLYSNKDVKKKK